MKTVYETTNAADAHLVSNLLQQHGIDASVVGQELGPYTHALGAVRVLVAADEEPAARHVVADWESSVPVEPQEVTGKDAPSGPRMPSRETAVLLIGGVLLLVVLWYFTGI